MKRAFLLIAAGLLSFSASAQPLPPPGGAGSVGSVTVLYTYGNSTGVGNGADTTEDTLLTFNIPAGALKAVGDRLKIFASGSMAASTDLKTARVRLGVGGPFQGVSGQVAGATSWFVYMEVLKTAAGASQQQASYGIANNSAAAVGSAALTLTDTSSIALTITGQNSTTATAGTIIVKYVSVEYLP